MLDNQFINNIIGVEEAYQMPERLMDILSDREKRESVFDKFLEQEPDLSYDWFTQYYQEEHGDRDKLKQDFTPDSICQIVTGLNGHAENVADICSGTGGLTIKMWQQNPDAFFHCEEVAARAIPVLLFNLAIRGVNGEVIHGDTLTGKRTAVYRLERHGKYSDIIPDTAIAKRQFDKVIMNPPYSLSWSGEEDGRFRKCGTPPKSKADYAFVLHGLNMMQGDGTLTAILPHGVLFRGQKEATIRKNLIKDGLIDTVIGMPDHLFLNTGIPVCIMLLRKHEDGIYFIDASGEFTKGHPQNTMEEAHIKTVLDSCRMRRNIDKLSYLADNREIEENGYNLNIPRYVDTFEPEEVPDLSEVFDELVSLEKESYEAEKTFFEMMKQLTGTNEEAQKELGTAIEKMQEYLEERNGQLQFIL